MTVAGTGNLLTMTRPEFGREVPGLKVIAEEGEVSAAIEGGTLKGTRKFTYTLIPEKNGEMRPGRVRLAFFDPGKKAYRVAESREVSFTAKGDAAARGGRFDTEGDERVSMNFLYPALIILAVAAAAVFVVIWERKRYRLAAGEGDAVKNSAEEKEPDEPDHLAAAGRCVLGRDGAGFLRAAEKPWDEYSAPTAGMSPVRWTRPLAGSGTISTPAASAAGVYHPKRCGGSTASSRPSGHPDLPPRVPLASCRALHLIDRHLLRVFLPRLHGAPLHLHETFPEFFHGARRASSGFTSMKRRRLTMLKRISPASSSILSLSDDAGFLELATSSSELGLGVSIRSQSKPTRDTRCCMR